MSRRGDTCPFCLGPLEGSTGMDPCWHIFCHTCILRWATTIVAATCLLCWGPIVAIRHLQMEDDHAVVAHRHRFHPYMRRGWQGRWRQQQGPRVPWNQSPSAEPGERSPSVPCQHGQNRPGQWDRDGHSQLHSMPEAVNDPLWLQRVQEEEPGSGDHAHHRLPWLRF